jgi:HD-like signal output (HDOD) protein
VFATRVPRASHWLPEQVQAHHAAVGGYLLGLWGFAETIVEAIVWHHMPSKCGETRLGLCGLLHVADVLAHARERGDEDTDGIGLEPGYLESLGLAQKWPAWLDAR